MNKIELLAPSGNIETFFAAVSAGADAIYLGMKNFSARNKAQNFSFSELNSLCNYAKEKNIKIFIAFNTLLQENDIKKAFSFLEQLSVIEPDALIVQDFAVVNIVKKYFPNLKLHASTQLTIHNSFGAEQAKKAGFKRVVLARELSFEQIKTIRQETDIELEIFCHGALCFCVSGLCLLSSFIGGYSGNRGYCTQPCRRLWTINNKQGYFLSPKDLQLADYMQQIKNIGINCLKIEGRMKNKDYVYKTVKAYRILIDSSKQNFNEALKEAKELLNFDYARSKTIFNFMPGNKNIIEPKQSKNIGLFLGKIFNKTVNSFDIKTKYKIYEGDKLRIVDDKNDKNFILQIKNLNFENDVYTIFCDEPFINNNFEVFKIADGEHRKNECMEEWMHGKNIGKDNTVKVHKDKKIEFLTTTFVNNKKDVTKIFLPKLFIRINNLSWLPLIKNTNLKIIICLEHNLLNQVRNLKNINDFYFELPAYIDQENIKQFNDTILDLIKNKAENFFINNLSHFEFFKNVKVNLYGGQFLYTLNTFAAEFLSNKNIKAFTVSAEDNLTNIKILSNKLNNKLIVYLFGFPKLAISKIYNDINNKTTIKTNKDTFQILKDNNFTTVLSKYPVNLFEYEQILTKLKINSFVIDLSFMEPDKNFINLLLNAFNGKVNLNSMTTFNFEKTLQ